MRANEYQEQAARTISVDRLPHWGFLISGLGIAGEAGEVADMIKKVVGHRHPMDLEKFKLELGDVLWYVADLCTLAGFTMEEVMEANIEKLLKRYPNGWNSEDSLARRDER